MLVCRVIEHKGFRTSSYSVYNYLIRSYFFVNLYRGEVNMYRGGVYRLLHPALGDGPASIDS